MIAGLLQRLPRQLFSPIHPFWGHEPGKIDVYSAHPGLPIWVRPNFRNFAQVPMPYWWPLYPEPANPASKADRGKTINKGWPLEQPPWWMRWRSYTLSPRRPYPLTGDWVEVIDQVTGEPLHNSKGESSDVWYVVAVPVDQFPERAKRYGHRYQLITHNDVLCFKAYGSALWAGNTGIHYSINDWRVFFDCGHRTEIVLSTVPSTEMQIVCPDCRTLQALSACAQRIALAPDPL